MTAGQCERASSDSTQRAALRAAADATRWTSIQACPGDVTCP